MPAQTTGTLTEPSVAFTVPLAEIAFDHTGKPISRSDLASRTPASMTSALTPRAISEVASRSPNMPSVLSAEQPTTRMSPGLALLDRDMDHPVVAGMRQHGHRGARRLAALPDRAQIGLHQADAAIGLVHGGDAERAEPLHQIRIGALDVANDDRLHANSSTAIGNSR